MSETDLQVEPSVSIAGQRLRFIDMIRSLSIILMLEGHFIILTIGDEYRSRSGIFFIFQHIRGLTAPMFLTVTGLIFTYLLLNNSRKEFNLKRVKKGLKRSAELIAWGYLLQLNFVWFFRSFEGWDKEWFKITNVYHWNPIGYFGDKLGGGVVSFHVLHCIGFGILLILLIYCISRVVKFIPIFILFFIAGTAILCCYPALLPYAKTGFPEHAPSVIQNMFMGERAFFPIVPFAGFVMYGGMLGAIIERYNDKILSYLNGLIFMVSGGLIIFFNALIRLYIDLVLQKMGLIEDKYMQLANVVWGRFGEVLIILGVFIMIEKRFPNIKTNWFVTMGQNTFPIFVIHVIALYGGISGFGIDSIYSSKNELPALVHHPIFVVCGAIIFVGLFAHLSKHIDRYNAAWAKILQKVFWWSNSTMNKSRYYMFGGVLSGLILYLIVKSIKLLF